MKYHLLLILFLFFEKNTFAQVDTNYQWTWVKGLPTVAEKQYYGTQGMGSQKNTPGGRTKYISWTDKAGNPWLFGGTGFSNGFDKVNYNDLWKFDIATNQWIWISGDSTGNVEPVFGLKGITDSKNNPGSRQGSSSWTDLSGNFWLFGGGQRSSNDLWKYNIMSNQWTWVSGDSAGNAPLIYGTKGVPDENNNPGTRNENAFWTDKAGNFWLWGSNGILNDLWKYDPSSSLWTWVSGDSAYNAVSVYGTKGVQDVNSRPGARVGTTYWTDSVGNLWLLGGYKDQGLRWPSGYCNDLWKFNIASSQWTWVKGDSTVDSGEVIDTKGIASPLNKPGGMIRTASWTDHSGNLWVLAYRLWKYDPNSNLWTWYQLGQGVYGMQGQPSEQTFPGGRHDSGAWVDASGNFWLFGGNTGPDQFGNYYNDNLLNDLWKYDLTIEKWIWMKGGSSHGNRISYGTQGVPSPDNNPDAGFSRATWIDQQDNLWIFGGNNSNDLWKYDPLQNIWNWVKGDGYNYKQGLYGTKGVSSPYNSPSERTDGMTWKDKQGNLWLFGGIRNFYSHLNDLWKYNPKTNQWTWMKGDSTVKSSGIYGKKGVASPNSTPGGRLESAYWTDKNGNFWLFGGDGYVSGADRMLSDLWKYEPATNNWTWVHGDSTEYGRTIYGVQGVAAPENNPGPRYRSLFWSDNQGNLWLFGGQVQQSGYADLNDLWKYNIASNQWTWVRGDTSLYLNGVPTFSKAVYGTKGVGSILNTPGGRESAVNWTDNAGNLWLFGGSGNTATSFGWNLNDLWKYDPLTNQWTWINGDSTGGTVCEYGIMGQFSPQNNPGARVTSVGWKDSKNDLWLFGGYGGYSTIQLFYHDLWKFTLPFTPIIEDTTTTIDSTAVNNLEIKIAPNPVRKIVTISTPLYTGTPLVLKVFNISGIQLKSVNINSGKTEIDMSLYSSGMYIIWIEDKQKKSIVKKLILKE